MSYVDITCEGSPLHGARVPVRGEPKYGFCLDLTYTEKRTCIDTSEAAFVSDPKWSELRERRAIYKLDGHLKALFVGVLE